MNRFYFLSFLLFFVVLRVSGQTTLTEDNNGVLNTSAIVAQTTSGQSFYTGHQLGSGYSFPQGIFHALSDNPAGSANYFYDGLANGVTNFSVRADGQGYFAGNLGVGTNSTAKFAVYQATGLGSTVQSSSLLSTVSGLSGAGNDFQNNIWLVRNAPGSDWYSTRLHDGISVDNSFQTPQVNTLTWWERDPANNIQSWGSQATTYLSIHNGNVGIGTTDNANWQLGTSTYKLAVNGSIVATAVTVKSSNNWPDYVFNSTYKLSRLRDVKNFINVNHHLPDMPSAETVSKNGINLGETAKLLTEKIEELTLYLIQKDNERTRLQQQINIQNKKLLDQEKLLKIQNDRIGKLEAAVEKLTSSK